MKKLLVISLVLFPFLLFNHCSGQSVNTNSGTDFWFGYTLTSDGLSADYVVYITTLKTTSGTVSIPGQAWSQTFTVVPNTPQRIVLPSADVIVTNFSAPVGMAVNVVSDSNISVSAGIEHSERSDNAVILPVPLLGNQYYIMDDTIMDDFTEIAIVAQSCHDSVEIIPTRNITVGGNHPAYVPYTVVLNPGEMYLIQSNTNDDLTGTLVQSLNHAETGVFAGADWTSVNCNGTANPFYEQLYPINTWGKDFVFVPTAEAEDDCRILSEQNGTTVTITTSLGHSTHVLNAGQYFDTSVVYYNSGYPVYISSNNPIEVGRFLRTGACNNYYITNPSGKGDPSEGIIGSISQMLLDTISFALTRTPDLDSSYVQVITPTPAINTVFLDNANIGAYFTTLAANPAYSYASLTILQGAHTLTTNGPGFLAYTVQLGDIDAMATAAGVYLQEINISTTSTNPSSCGASNGTATATATGIPPFIYSWSNGQTRQTATGLSAGIYTVNVQDSDCVPHKAYAIVNISSKAGYTASVTDTNPGCRNVLGKSTVYPSGGTSPYTYSWNIGQTTQTATGLTPGSYTCVITDNTGCKYFATTVIIPYVVPSIGISPYHDSSCGVASQLLHVYGLNNNVYNWAPHSGLSCYNCPDPTATPTATTTYTISGTDSNGCSASAAITIAVLSTPNPVITGQSLICSGESDTLRVTGGVTYSWSNNATSSSIIISPLNTTTYTVTASNGYCPSADATFTVTVVQSPNASISVSNNPVCLGDSVLFKGSGGGTYKWSFGSTADSIWLKPVVSKTYSLIVYLGTCTDTAKINLTVSPSLTVTAVPKNPTICLGNSVDLTASGANSYSWTPAASLSCNACSNPTATPTVTTIYTLTGTTAGCTGTITDTVHVLPKPVPVITVNPDTVCPNDTAVLTATGLGKYEWSTGQTSAIIKVTPAATKTYTLILSNAGCAIRDSVTINTIPKLTARYSIIDSVICPYDTAYLSVFPSASPATYIWSNNATTSAIKVTPGITTTYTATVYGVCNSADRIIKVTVIPLPIPVITGHDSVCKGLNDTLVISGGTTYLWSNGSSKTTYIMKKVTADSTISVTLFNGKCSVDTTIKIGVIEPPSVSVNYQNICMNQCTTLKAIGMGTDIHYLWSNNAVTDTTTVCPTTDSSFMVNVTNVCTNVAGTATITVYHPTIFACCDTLLDRGDSTILTATGAVGRSYYSWSPSAGLNCTTCPTVIASPSVTTTYTVTGTDSNHCTIFTKITVMVEDFCFDYTVPNVFTPNGDGINDQFKIIPLPAQENLYLSSYSITIYDRWGKQMYKSSDYTQHWNGNTEGGDQASDGVYYWIISATCQGKNYNKQGFVQLIR